VQHQVIVVDGVDGQRQLIVQRTDKINKYE